MTTALVKLFNAVKTDQSCKFDAPGFNQKPLADTNQPVSDSRYYYIESDVDNTKSVVNRQLVPQSLNRWPLLFTFIREYVTTTSTLTLTYDLISA